jgi:hypothetical protein
MSQGSHEGGIGRRNGMNSLLCNCCDPYNSSSLGEPNGSQEAEISRPIVALRVNWVTQWTISAKMFFQNESKRETKRSETISGKCFKT